MADLIARQTAALQRRLGITESAQGSKQGSAQATVKPQAAIWFEKAPWSIRGSKCKLSGCDEPIEGGDYRIAVVKRSGERITADFYHIECLEKIADLTQKEYLERTHAVTGRTWKTRGLKVESYIDGNYLCDHGAERLFMAWHYNRAKHLALADSDDAETDQLYPPVAKPFVWEILDVDDPRYIGKWALYHSVLSKHADTTEKHSLSKMMKCWQNYKIVARTDEEKLSIDDKALREEIGEDGVVAIKDLACIHM